MIEGRTYSSDSQKNELEAFDLRDRVEAGFAEGQNYDYEMSTKLALEVVQNRLNYNRLQVVFYTEVRPELIGNAQRSGERVVELEECIAEANNGNWAPMAKTILEESVYSATRGDSWDTIFAWGHLALSLPHPQQDNK